ncbi:hypothetical protein TNCV_1897921 [Trichonephila clavipes]|uniref:Uncharacterized protein n=1 Tax=Trichonephila clavipes TaxID=2585209 RepID=A0A8X6WEJ0_TRICX|nr:hypothetical protein TNCV_1897921 [Trichonephila clavipes]
MLVNKRLYAVQAWKKVSRTLWLMDQSQVQELLLINRNVFRTIRNTYIAHIRPILEYGVPVYKVASASNLDKLKRVQLSVVRIITGVHIGCQRDIVLHEAESQITKKILIG